VPCRIIDREPVASPFSKALAVHARTLELLENLGIAETFSNRGLKLNAFNVFDRGRHIVRMSFSELESRYPYILSLPQSATERILSENFIARGGVIERGVTLKALLQDAEGVTVSLDRADGRTEKFRCAWVAGCDGAHSDVRHLLNVKFQGAKYPEYYVLADVNFETKLDISENYIFSNGWRLSGFHAFSRSGARIFADIDLPESGREHPQVTLEQIQEHLDDCGAPDLRLTKLNWLSTFFVHKRQAVSYRHGRVFLAGDAAHIHSPASGQGMNVGMQDAFNLAWKLALVERGKSPDSLLDSYSAERHYAGLHTLRMTDFFQRLNTIHNPLLQKVRGSLGPVLSRQTNIRHRYRNAVSGLSVHYEKSDVIREDARPFHEGPKAGERAPDGMLYDPRGGAKVRLLEVLREPCHHLLLFAARNAPDSEILPLLYLGDFVHERYEGLIRPFVISSKRVSNPPEEVVVFQDRDFSLHEKYGAAWPAIYLIRPDGYVAYRSFFVNLPRVRTYLEKIFR
jgi:2-polyprenyl-6-methoxyphenol hydroxylase-like FAD-dependent oxidoreductase